MTIGISTWIGDRSKKLYHHTMEMEQMMARLLAEMKSNQAKMVTSLKEIRVGQEFVKEEILAKAETRAYANNEKFEDLGDTPIFRVDIHQARIARSRRNESQDGHTVHSIRSELKETVKHWVEDVLSCVDQKLQRLRKELTEKIDNTGGLTGSKDVLQYVGKEPPGNPSRYEDRPP
jgi:hypothetical protein